MADLHPLYCLKKLCFCNQIATILRTIKGMIKIVVAKRVKWSLISKKSMYIEKIKNCCENAICVYTCSLLYKWLLDIY